MLDQPAKNKLLLLFIFEKMDTPLSENTLVDMVTTNKWLDLFECKEAFISLVNSNFIVNASKRVTFPRYTLTSDGRECLKNFFHILPTSLRESISDHILANKRAYRRSQDYISDYFKNTDGTYTVVLKIECLTSVLLEMRLTIEQRSKAIWIFKNWKNYAETIYENIHNTLLE